MQSQLWDEAVTVLVHENDETFDVTPDQEAELLHALAEVDRGDFIRSQQFLKDLRSRLI